MTKNWGEEEGVNGGRIYNRQVWYPMPTKVGEKFSGKGLGSANKDSIVVPGD